jgi:hypothetical protein
MEYLTEIFIIIIYILIKFYTNKDPYCNYHLVFEQCQYTLGDLIKNNKNDGK